MKRKQAYYNSRFRVLLTEVLPYELPLVYDNAAFFDICRDEEKFKIFESLLLGKDGVIQEGKRSDIRKYTIPFDYDTSRLSGTSTRRLSLIHPSVQLDWVNFYEEYADYLLYLCNKSPFSIRYIHKKSNCVVDQRYEYEAAYIEEPEDIDETLDATKVNDQRKNYYLSYFRYRKYDIINRYYDGHDALRLETKYAHLMRTDISHCFNHIYTHSIAWAIRGKEVAKNQRSDIFQELCENRLDVLMRQANYGETNGIVIGPEVSRIFAEIILQRTDVDLMLALKEHGLRLGTHYEIRRYVDDYFVYAHRKEDLEKIKSVMEDCLNVYKLHLNTSKTILYERPFATNRSDLMAEMQNLVRWLYDTIRNRTTIEDGAIYLSFVRKYRSMVHHYNVQYADISSVLLSKILTRIKYLSKSKDDKEVPILKENVIANMIEIVFYVFALNMTYTTSHKVCYAINMLVDAAKRKGDKIYLREICYRIEREIKRSFDLLSDRLQPGKSNMEIINLLLTWHRVLPNSTIDTNRLAALLGRNAENEIVKDDWRKLNYYQIMTLLYIIEDNPKYNRWKTELVKQVKNNFKKNNWRQYAECVNLFFDTLTCPYLDEEIKDSILTGTQVCSTKKIAKEKREEMDYIGIKRWFWDWDKSRPFERALYMKMFHPAYG